MDAALNIYIDYHLSVASKSDHEAFICSEKVVSCAYCGLQDVSDTLFIS